MIVLASASARRAELLSAAGFEFDIAPANVDETPRDGEAPTEYVLRIARAKADRISTTQPPERVVLAADTVVVAGERMMGKPVDRRDAESMLRALSGAVHHVHTAVVVQARARQVSEVVTTRVRVLPLSDDEIAWYLATGEPDGKAGAYGIQGRAARFIDWIDGSWSNVVGLPISTVYRLLKQVAEPD
jgi:septum formation protein